MTHRLLARAAAVVAAGALTVTGLVAGGGAASAAPAGDTSLAEVLAADGTRFDRDGADFDIAERAVLTVLEAKPRSPLRALTNGDRRLTVFLPTDNAFRFLVGDLTGDRPRQERRVFNAVASLGVDTVEAVLLYHVVPGKTLTSPKVVAAAKERARVETALGKHVKVRPSGSRIELVDADRDDRNPLTIAALLDVNRGNKQVAHGIDRVLRPADL